MTVSALPVDASTHDIHVTSLSLKKALQPCFICELVVDVFLVGRTPAHCNDKDFVERLVQSAKSILINGVGGVRRLAGKAAHIGLVNIFRFDEAVERRRLGKPTTKKKFKQEKPGKHQQAVYQE